MKPTLRIKNLTCCRGPVCLVKDFNLTIEAGQVIRLSGPNGCGKSSLLKSIIGRLIPTHGEITYNQAQLTSDEFIFLDHKNLMKPNLTINENLSFWADLYEADQVKKLHALESLGLTPLIDLRTKELSQGQIKRAQLSLLLLKEANIWLLDEPLNSLDKNYIVRLGELFHTHIQQGGMVIFASHSPIPGLPETVVELDKYALFHEDLYEASNFN